MQDWTNREKDYQAWLDSHTVTDPELGKMLDVRDTEHIWCKGTIERVLKL